MERTSQHFGEQPLQRKNKEVQCTRKSMPWLWLAQRKRLKRTRKALPHPQAELPPEDTVSLSASHRLATAVCISRPDEQHLEGSLARTQGALTQCQAFLLFQVPAASRSRHEQQPWGPGVARHIPPSPNSSLLPRLWTQDSSLFLVSSNTLSL